jgi:putative ABC transport system ATP-binding protein
LHSEGKGEARGIGLRLRDISVAFSGKTILDIPRLDVGGGSLVALTGPSGSGKTTLLHILAGILKANTGSVLWADTDLPQLRQSASDAWRYRNVGLVFQEFHLIDQLSPIDNVTLPATFSNFAVPNELHRRAVQLLSDFGVPIGARSVKTLSRGERQRTAIARALLLRPSILLADEPTASLDEETARQITETLTAAATGQTIFIVTHDPIVIERCPRVIRLERGKILSDTGASANTSAGTLA